MQKPKVSVIIPVYNAEETIGNILEKLTSQSYKNIEVIAINDGSTDSSWNILQKHASIDKRVITVKQKNKGVSAARNAGIKLSSGEFIMFIDSDDAISLKLISELASHILDDSDFIMCGMNLNGKEISSQDTLVKGRIRIAQYVLKSLLSKNLLYGPCCKLFRRNLVLEHGLVFPTEVKYGEDTVFNLNYLSKTRNLKMIDKSLYTYQITENGLSSTNISVTRYRKARSEALKQFIKGSANYRVWILYFGLRIRWSAAYMKATLRSML